MVLYSEFERRRKRDELEAIEGTVWVDNLPGRARVKIAALWETVIESGSPGGYTAYVHTDRWAEGIARIMRLGAGYQLRSVEPKNLVTTESTEYALDLIGAFFQFLTQSPELRAWVDPIRDQINTVLEDFRVPFRLVDDSIVPLASDELHTNVVLPALGLLVGAKHEGANRAYIKALKEIAQDPADAITDAGTALQSVLVTLGCNGNALGPLIKDARKNGLLAGHDEKLTDGILKMMDWASANRSERGDGHHTSDATRADAWLMIHVVGALIASLLDPTRSYNSA
ncbi:hypothetical protein [Aeromicrobium sp. 179-A 4D2 NHS]|uniref:hypothetical protein n=1 Tax=Aeromicrobium sp. 179-A 4D2 NHS TaxID=3142375 RepID=UPI0039A255BD